MIAAVWYPPGDWQPGEIVVTKTLPPAFARHLSPGHGGGTGGQLWRPAPALPRYPRRSRPVRAAVPGPLGATGDLPAAGTIFDPQPGRAQPAPADRRRGPIRPIHPADRLPAGRPARRPPAQPCPCFCSGPPANPSTRITPCSFTCWPPTARWLPKATPRPRGLPRPPRRNGRPTSQCSTATGSSSPPNLPAGAYTLQAGLYHPLTLERLTLPGGGSTFELGQVEVRE